MLHAFAFNELAVIVRHWFEIGPEDEEHGTRVELRRLVPHQHRGSESAPQVTEIDGIIWRADLFDVCGAHPGTFDRAHYHLRFDGVEPTDRAWDAELSSDPFGWLRRELGDLPRVLASQDVTLQDMPGEVADIRRSLPQIIEASLACAPARCRTGQDCLAMTRDTTSSLGLMISRFRAGVPEDPRVLAASSRNEWPERPGADGQSGRGNRC